MYYFLPRSTIAMRRLAVVIDPLLFFSTSGVALVKALSGVVDVWLPRELWNVLKNVHIFVQHPDLITMPELLRQAIVKDLRLSLKDYQHSLLSVLQQWHAFQSSRGLAGMNVYWIGDSIQESLLPEGISSDVFYLSERLASSFDNQISSQEHIEQSSLFATAFRDAASLAVSLNSALILTRQLLTGADSSSPALCSFYGSLGFNFTEASATDPVAIQEQNYLLQIMVQTGYTNLLWGPLHLAAVHLVETSPSRSIEPVISETNRTYCAPALWSDIYAVWHRIPLPTTAVSMNR